MPTVPCANGAAPPDRQCRADPRALALLALRSIRMADIWDEFGERTEEPLALTPAEKAASTETVRSAAPPADTRPSRPAHRRYPAPGRHTHRSTPLDFRWCRAQLTRTPHPEA